MCGAMLDLCCYAQVTHSIFHRVQEGSSSPMSTDSSLNSQGDTMSTSCGSNLAASLQQASLTRSISADNAPATKLGSLQVASSPFCSSWSAPLLPVPNHSWESLESLFGYAASKRAERFGQV